MTDFWRKDHLLKTSHIITVRYMEDLVIGVIYSYSHLDYGGTEGDTEEDISQTLEQAAAAAQEWAAANAVTFDTEKTEAILPTSRRKGKAGPDGSESQKAPCLALLSDKDGTLPNWPISRMDHPPTRRLLLVVPVQDPNAGAPFQELPPVEESAEDSGRQS